MPNVFQQIKSLSDGDLISNTQNLARQERELLTQVLGHFSEIQRRRLFSDYGFGSLFEMATRHFGYSEDQAYRRIAAMKLLNHYPELESRVESGAINLSHLTIAQNVIRKERKVAGRVLAKSETLDLIGQMATLPVRKAEQVARAFLTIPDVGVTEQLRPVSPSQIELRALVSNETMEKLLCLKGFQAHKHPNLTFGELIDHLCGLGMQAWSPNRQPKTSQPLQPTHSPQLSQPLRPSQFSHLSQHPQPDQLSQPLQTSQYIQPPPISKQSVSSIPPPSTESSATPRKHRVTKTRLRRDTFHKSKNQCSICRSSFALEIDHIQPRAWGGTDDPANLRVLCRSCNQRQAIKKIGLNRMERYLNRS